MDERRKNPVATKIIIPHCYGDPIELRSKPLEWREELVTCSQVLFATNSAAEASTETVIVKLAWK